MPTMRAVVQHQWGDPDVLGVESISLPEPGDDEVRIKVEAAAANPVDILVRTGMLATFIPGFEPPTTPGVDAAGVIDAVGPNVTAFMPGDPVVAMVLSPRPGTFAEFVIAPIDTVAKRHASVAAGDGATLPLAGLTALAGLESLGLLEPGAAGPLYVDGALGAVGGFAVQIAAHLGIEVIGAARPGQADQVRALGAVHVVNRDGDVAQQIRSLYPDGADYAFDVVGGHAARSAVGAIRDSGRYTTSVAPSQNVAGSPDPDHLDRQIRGTTIYVAPNPNGLRHLAGLMSDRAITARIHSRHTLEETADVHRLLATPGLIGKILVIPEIPQH